MSQMTYRWILEERHGDGPWTTQDVHEMDASLAEIFVMLVNAFPKGMREGRLAPDAIERFAAELLDIDLDEYCELPPIERIALVIARGAEPAATSMQ